jgi:hypothetical protein
MFHNILKIAVKEKPLDGGLFCIYRVLDTKKTSIKGE